MMIFILLTSFFCFLFIFLLKLELHKPLQVIQNLRSNHKNANSLYHSLLTIHEKIMKNGSSFELPKYKYFTSLIDDLFYSMKQFGTSINEYMPELKRALVNDIRFEKKIRREYHGGLFQMFFVQIFGGIFLFSMHIQLSKEFFFNDYILCFSLQLLGYACFILIFKIVKYKTFNHLDSYIATLYQIKVLTHANISLKQIHKRVKIEKLVEDKQLGPIKRRIFEIMSQIKATGVLCSEDIEMAIEEIWFINEFKFEQFLRHLSALKLIVIVVFFLSSFMLILMQVLESLAV